MVSIDRFTHLPSYIRRAGCQPQLWIPWEVPPPDVCQMIDNVRITHIYSMSDDRQTTFKLVIPMEIQ